MVEGELSRMSFQVVLQHGLLDNCHCLVCLHDLSKGVGWGGGGGRINQPQQGVP